MSDAPLTLLRIRRMLEGVIPPGLCTVSADGMPHATFLSHAEYVDPEHVALTYQFFNHSRRNVLATRRAAILIEDGYTGASVSMQLEYLRTELSGPVFERLRAKLAGIAAHSGMADVFKLRGADIYRVLEISRVGRPDLPLGLESRCDLAAGAREVSRLLADCSDLGGATEAMSQGLRDALRIEHSILWWLDAPRQTLITLASCGYDRSGIGAEVEIDDAGLAGVALREGVPIRICHMTRMYLYGRTWRERVRNLGMEAVLRDEIPLPGLEAPSSQLAVPLRALGRTVGVLLVESEREHYFSYDDEDTLALLCGQLAQTLLALQSGERESVPPRPGAREALAPGASGQSGGGALDGGASGGGDSGASLDGSPDGSLDRSPVRLRHYPRDGTVFVDDAYLIKGVAGAILWRLANEYVSHGRSEFTTRELRLAGADLRLPDLQDNLGVRLLLLQRRLIERDCPLRLERIGRGRFRLLAHRPLQLQREG